MSRTILSGEGCISRLLHGKGVWVVLAEQPVWAEWTIWVVHGDMPGDEILMRNIASEGFRSRPIH